MADFVITHRIEAPELTAAINSLADALKGRSVSVLDTSSIAAKFQQETPAQAPTTPPVAVQTPTPTAAPATTGVNGASSATTRAPAPAPVEAPAPAPAATSNPAPTPAAPPVKVYTFEDITAAGSQLLELGKMPQLMELLKGYGVQAVTQLKPEQYADVAKGLKELGANI